MKLEWFGHSTQQNDVRASAMVKTRLVLNSYSWDEEMNKCCAGLATHVVHCWVRWILVDDVGVTVKRPNNTTRFFLRI